MHQMMNIVFGIMIFIKIILTAEEKHMNNEDFKKDLNKIITDFGKSNDNFPRIFQSEAQFQFELAIALKNKFGSKFEILLEVLTKDKQDNNKIRQYTDIIVVDNSSKEYYAIELKYKTREFTDENETVHLLNHSAQDFGRYDYLKDLYRLEQLSDIENTPPCLKSYSFAGGYAIMLTNDHLYWETETEKTDSIYKYFCISKNDIIKKNTPLNWYNKENSGFPTCVNKSRQQLLIFKNEYSIHWTDYCDISDKNDPDRKYGEFKYLILSVLSSNN